MNSLIDLQAALLSGEGAQVKDFFDAADRRTGNDAMLRASEAFGLKVGFLNGFAVTTGAEISRLLGYTSDSSIREMRSKYDLLLLSPGSSSLEMTKLREVFGLHQNDGRTVFCWWDTILVCAMKGRTPEAEKIQLYLLNAERAARVLTDKDALRMRQQNWREARDFARLVELVRKQPDDPLTDLLIEKIEEASGRRIPRLQSRLTLVSPPDR